MGEWQDPKTQFKQGQSGNPKGRPKGVISFQERIRRMVDVKINYKDVNGKDKKTTLGDALIVSMSREALYEGDVGAARLIMEHLDGKPLQKSQVVTASLEEALKILDEEDKKND